MWINAQDVTWVNLPGNSDTKAADVPKVAFLWGEPEVGKKNGTFLKLPSGFKGQIKSGDAPFRAVIVTGTASHQVSDETDVIALDTGSYFGSKAPKAHDVTCTSSEDCVFYMSVNGKYNVNRL